MCGISGFISQQQNQYTINNILLMNSAIAHRGQDDEGYIILQSDHKPQHFSGKDTYPILQQKMEAIHHHLPQPCKVAMGFRRMSILDISEKGHQPMSDDNKQITITFNGEIYNYKSIRKTLIQAGFVFTSDTDTEVVLNAYKYWGISFIAHLNGMFSIAILDLNKEKLLLIRDRIGIKPLFYAHVNNAFIWCSEIKGILTHKAVQASINWSGIAKNFYLQSTPAPETCFTHIKNLPAAHYIQYDLNSDTFDIHQYWQLPTASLTDKININDAIQQINTLLQQSVAMQLQADVEVTTMMSGGIDSTTITAIAAQKQPDIHCFSMGFADKYVKDELPQAQVMAKSLQIQHHIHKIHADDVVGNLYSQLKHFEDPYNDYEIVDLAAQLLHQHNFKVVLSGNGADELFGGYPYNLHLKKWQQRQHFSFLQYLLPPFHSKVDKIKNALSLHSTLHYYANAKTGMRRYQLKKLGMQQYIPLSLMENDLILKDITALAPTEQLFGYDMHYSLSNHHVMRDDLSAMHHHVEMRYPFLDHELINFVSQLPVKLRYNGVTTKPLLRQLAKQYIHTDNLNMPKKGFSAPLGYWINTNPALRAFIIAQLENLKKREIFHNTTINQWIKEIDIHFTFHKIWQLVTFEIWLQSYID